MLTVALFAWWMHWASGTEEGLAKAVACWQEAVALGETENHYYVASWSDLGTAERMRGNIAQAREIHAKALSILESAGNNGTLVCHSYFHPAQRRGGQMSFVEALTFALSTLDSLREAGGARVTRATSQVS